MMAGCSCAAHGARLFGKALLGVVMVCCLTDVASPQLQQAGTAYDVTQRRLEEIPAGTVIDREAPRGWTHLIVKSRARPGAGDMQALSPVADRLSRILFTAVVADVRPERVGGGTRYKLARVAVGLGTTVGGEDTVLTPDTRRRLAPDLGFLAGLVIDTAHDKLREVTVVARSRTMLLFDSPAWMVRRQAHRPVILRHAVLVDEQTGHLDTLLWVLDRDDSANYSGPVGAIQWLPPAQIVDCVLHVDASTFALGQPTERTFAMNDPPLGQKEVPVGDDLKPLLVRQRFSRDAAADLETRLREAMLQAK